MSTVPDGLYEYGGVPVGGARFSSPWATHWFVDATDGSATNSGRRPDDAFSTIQLACTAAGTGDVIYIRPQTFHDDRGFNRYDEAVTLATTNTSDVFSRSRVSIIGVSPHGPTGDFLGVRWKRTTGTAFTVEAPGVHVENIGWFSEGATYGVLLSHDGATQTKQGSQGASFYNCAFKGKGLYVLSGGDGLTISNTRFQCAWDGTVAQLNYSASANPGRRMTVRNCEWLDGNGTAPSAACITIAAPLTEFLIRDCYFPQSPTGDVYIATAGANYGLIANCYFNTAELDTNLHITLGTGVNPVGCYDLTGIATTA